MVPPQLKHNGIQSLLEQSIRRKEFPKKYSIVFGKVLVVNNIFVDVGKKQEVYRLDIELHSTNEIGVSFQARIYKRTHEVVQSFDKTCAVLKLLKSAFLDIGYRYDSTFDANDLSHLIQSTHGKNRLKISGINNIHVLNRVWQYLDQLRCRADLLALVGTPREKPFDELDVWGIKNNGQLNTALRHPTRKLTLKFHEDFVGTLNDGDQLPNNVVERCELNFHRLENFNQLIPIVQKVCGDCPRMKKLKICCYDWDIYANTFEELVNDIKQRYDLFTNIIQSAHNLLPKLKISAYFDFYTRMINLQLPEDWKLRFKQRTGTSFLVEEVERNNGKDVEVMKTIAGKSKATFCYTFRY